MTLTGADSLGVEAREADAAFQMDEDAFSAFYERTARMLWAYLSRMSGDTQLADDLLQEAYFRFLRCGVPFEGEAHRRNYLFRIATNLVRDAGRRRVPETARESIELQEIEEPLEADTADRAARRVDVRRAMSRLKPRERELLWLAYAEGSSHSEIAQATGLKAASVKPLLFRARRRLAGLLKIERRGK